VFFVNSARDKFILFSFFMQILTTSYDYCINATKNVNEYSFPFKPGFSIKWALVPGCPGAVSNDVSGIKTKRSTLNAIR
jgi:hypothetical protein